MNFVSLIESKRDGHRLTAAQLHEIVAGVVTGALPDYQLAAFLMAVFFRGLNSVETNALTLAMRDSGDVLKFPKESRPLVDKHSTGGVGDKVSLPLAPLLACLGFRVPMISGRGLGITGGTLDKLDSIPGFKTLLPARRIVEIVQRVGCVMCGQTDRMVPADKRIYALRDVTGTVPSIPLITASVLAKKLAENLDALVLDVKWGRAAFMQTRSSARKLAESLVSLGQRCGVNTRAVLTDMNTPLGTAVGNWLEVKESVNCLDGNGPEDLRQLVLTFAASLLVQTGIDKSATAARRRAEACLDSGAPRKKWDEMLRAQGADLEAFQEKLHRDHAAPVVLALSARKSGYVAACDARVIGEVVRELGGGRLTKETRIHFEVGLDQIAKPRQRVRAGDTLCRIHAVSRTQAIAAGARLRAAFKLSARPTRSTPVVCGTLEVK